MPRKTRYEIEKAFSYDDGSRSYQRTLLTSLLVVVISLAAVIYYLFSVTQVNGMPVPLERSDKLQDVLSKGGKIPLEAHIMSKCPDAKDCLRDLVLPAMQQVSDKVDFTLSYIGTPTDNDDGVSCKHGPTECLGNMIELCAAAEYPNPKIYLGFTMCLTDEYKKIPDKDLIEDCALEHAMSFDRLNGCMSDSDGRAIGMLRDSVERSAAAGVTKSCTIRLDNKIRCIRDDGEWYDCPGGSAPKDLIADINKLYEARTPSDG